MGWDGVKTLTLGSDGMRFLKFWEENELWDGMGWDGDQLWDGMGWDEIIKSFGMGWDEISKVLGWDGMG